MAVQFDGTNYLQLATDLGVDQAVPYSFAFWVYVPDAARAASDRIVSLTKDAGNNYIRANMVGTTGPGDQSFGADQRNGTAGTVRATASAASTTDNWHSVLVTVAGPNAGDLSVHVDGNTTGLQDASAQTPPAIDRWYVGADRGFEGVGNGVRVARFCVIDGVASAANITAFHAGGWPATVFGANLIAHYDFANGALLTDSSGSSHTLTEVGAGAVAHVADPAGLDYGAPSGPAITNVDGDNTLFEGQTSVQVNGSGFGASQGTGNVKISPTNDSADVNAVTQTIGTWGDTQITLSAISFPAGVAEGGTGYVFVTADGGSVSASQAVTRLDITAPLLSAGTATGITSTAATPQVATNEVTGQAWFVMVPSAEATPTDVQIKAGQNAAGGAPTDSGTVNPVSADPIIFGQVTGLSPSTSYKIAFYQEDDATPTPNGSNVTTHTFSTLALPTITSAPLANAAPVTGRTGLWVKALSVADGSVVASATGVAQEVDGTVVLSDAAMVAATDYIMVVCDPSDGARHIGRYTAA